MIDSNQPKRLAVLVSGSGTNFENLARRIQSGELKNCKIVLVVSDNPDAYALKRAEQFRLETLILDRKQFKSREDFEEKLKRSLESAHVDYVLLAGFVRILSSEFVRAFRWRIMNIHPALLPMFPGSHAIREAFEAGVSETGVTVHFVDEGVDTGPVILQEKVRRSPKDTLESLEQKIHAVEYELYPKAVQLLVDGKLRVENGKVVMIGGSENLKGRQS